METRTKVAGSTLTTAAALTAAGVWLLSQGLRRLRRITLAGKTVLITGGSRGLGLVLAREFGTNGARIAICARDHQELQRARDDLQSRGLDVFTFVCDLTQRNQVGELVEAVRSHFGSIDVLVNNAGVIEVGPMEVMTLEDYEEAMKTHFWAALYSIEAALPEMRSRGQGRIVNIASIGLRLSVPHLLPYCASKFALAGFSEGLRAELGKDGILVTTVFPGLMRTGSPRNATFKGQHRKEYAWFSISDALPLLAMSAERAARKIVDACVHGDPELVLTPQAKLAALLHGLFPGLTTEVMGIANRLLPRPGGIGTARARGRESYSSVSPSWLTGMDERAARANNQIA